MNFIYYFTLYFNPFGRYIYIVYPFQCSIHTTLIRRSLQKETMKETLLDGLFVYLLFFAILLFVNAVAGARYIYKHKKP